MKAFLKLVVVLNGLMLIFSGCESEPVTDLVQKATNSSDEISFRTLDPDPATDCRCYMQLTGISGNPGGVGNDLWTLYDETGGFIDFEIQGSGNFWFPSNGVYEQPPTPFFELNTPSNGVHEMHVGYYGIGNVNFTLETEVRCFLQQNDGTELLLTTTQHDFTWTPSDADIAGEVIFYQEFSCYDLYHSPK